MYMYIFLEGEHCTQPLGGPFVCRADVCHYFIYLCFLLSTPPSFSAFPSLYKFMLDWVNGLRQLKKHLE